MNQPINDQMSAYMIEHVLSHIKVIIGTTDGYIQASKHLNLPTAFLEDVKSKLQAIVEQELIT